MESYSNHYRSGELFQTRNISPTQIKNVTPTITPVSFTGEHFEAFFAQRQEPPWLVALRREAWDTFCELPLPDVSLEEWRRTDIRAFKLDKFGLPTPSEEGAIPPDSLLTEGVD